MAADMYAKINPNPKRKKEYLPAMLVLPILATGVFIAIVVWGAGYHRKYQDYLYRLSGATNYACEHGLAVYSEKGIQALDADSAKEIFNLISLAGRGRVQAKPPLGDPAAVLDYGNGASLFIWEIPASDQSNEGHTSDIFLLFEDIEGSYGYISWNLHPHKIFRIVGSL